MTGSDMWSTPPNIYDQQDADDAHSRVAGLWAEAQHHATHGRHAETNLDADRAADHADALLAAARQIVALQSALFDWQNVQADADYGGGAL